MISGYTYTLFASATRLFKKCVIDKKKPPPYQNETNEINCAISPTVPSQYCILTRGALDWDARFPVGFFDPTITSPAVSSNLE